MTSTGGKGEAGRSLLVYKVENGRFESGKASDRIAGSVQLTLTQSGSEATAQLVYLGLYSTAAVSFRGTTGELRVTSRSGEGTVREGRLHLELQAEIRFAERTEAGYTLLAGSTLSAPKLPEVRRESFEGVLEGQLGPLGRDGSRTLRDVTLRLSRRKQQLKEPHPGGAVEAGAIEAAEGAGTAEELNFRLAAAPPAGLPGMTTATIQPVFFPGTGGTFNDPQVKTAQDLWRQCSIGLDVKPAIHLPDLAAAQQGSVNAIFNSLPSGRRLAGAIHVFVVADPIVADGGGYCLLENIVITDDNSGNFTLLAHEIGHALGLPDQTGNVMEPSDDSHTPSPQTVAGLCRHFSFSMFEPGGIF